MKNKIFKSMSKQKKEKHLIYVLKAKTHGLLNVNEEVALLSAGLKEKQFGISVYFDINKFKKEFTKQAAVSKIIFGSREMAKLNTQGKLVSSGIAALCDFDVHTGKEKRLLIYIPEVRRCNAECVREKYICENIEQYSADMLCCGLQRVMS